MVCSSLRALGGRRGVERCRGKPARPGTRPDVMLVDIDLGRESGFDIGRRLTREAELSPSPVILISTHAEEDYADLITACPAAGFLPKTRLSASAIRDLLGLPA